MAKIENPKELKIKIPVYTSKLTRAAKDAFGGVTYDHMISFLKKKIETYNSNGAKVTSDKRNKTFKKEIEGLSYTVHQVGNVPALLLQISAYNTNLSDGFFEKDTRINFEHDHKLGSSNNFILLYPYIGGIEDSNFTYQWLILLYEDPNKEFNELVSTAKLVLSKIFSIKTENIKLPAVLEELKKMKFIPALQLKLTSLTYEDNDIDATYRRYMTKSEVKRHAVDKFENMPFETTEQLITEDIEGSDYEKVEIKVWHGKRVFNITKQQMNDAKTSVKKSAEEVFNCSRLIGESDVPDMYKTDFIMSVLVPVLTEYLQSNVKA